MAPMVKFNCAPFKIIYILDIRLISAMKKINTQTKNIGVSFALNFSANRI